MAIKATIYKVKLDISDCDRNYFHKNKQQYNQLENLQIINIKTEDVTAMQDFVSRNMALQINIQEGITWLSDSSQTISIEPEVLL